MVNATVIVSATLVVIGAAVAIFMYMKTNGLTMDNTALLDACEGALGAEDDTCVMIRDQDIDWDTGIPCYEEAGAPEWNFRALIEELKKDWATVEGLPEGTDFNATHASDYILD